MDGTQSKASYKGETVSEALDAARRALDAAAGGQVTEAGVEWDSPASAEMYMKLQHEVERITDGVMQPFQVVSSAEMAGRRQRVIEETAEIRRQMQIIADKHLVRYAKTLDDGK